MAREPNTVAKGTKAATEAPASKKREPATPKVATQEAKDLRTLINTLSEKNAPETSKDITVVAKQTLKVVTQSQKSDSAAFKREATKSLINFRSFIEKTEKLSEARRSKLLNDIDSMTLDAKNSVFMMLSIAKEQTKNLKATAHREIANEKIKIKQMEKSLMTEAALKAKGLIVEAKLKSKALSQEQAAKFQLIADERKQRYINIVVNNKASIQKQKDDLKQRKLKLQQNDDQRKVKLAQQKADLLQTKNAQEVKNQTDRAQLKQDRNDAALKIKRIKTDMRDNYQTKMREGKDDINKRKADNLQRNKDRIQKIRVLTDEHKARLKKITEDARADGIIKKAKIKSEIEEINSKAKNRKNNHEKNANDLMGKVKAGIYDANPLIHAGVQIVSGIAGLVSKGGKDKKKEKALNRLQQSNNAPNPAPAPSLNPNPTPPPANGPNPPPAASGGMFAGIIAMLPSITGIISGIGTFFKSIGSAFGKMGGLLGGAKAIPIIGTAIMVVTSIFDFLEGFNNATALFGATVGDEDYTKKIFSGVVNVVTSMLNLFDTVAGWLGFDTDIAGAYKKAALVFFNKVSTIVNTIVDVVGGIFDSIMGAVRTMASSIGSILEYIPGAVDAAKTLKAFGSGGKSPGTITAPADTPTSAGLVNAKQNAVNDLKDEVDAKKANGTSIQVATDNSVKSNQTTIVQQKLDTRNDDPTHKNYGGSNSFW